MTSRDDVTLLGKQGWRVRTPANWCRMLFLEFLNYTTAGISVELLAGRILQYQHQNLPI